jgi:hypothetical protein
MNIEQFHRLSQMVGEEIRNQNTNYRRAISPEERLAFFFEVLAIKMYRDMKGILDTVGATLFLNKCPR